MKKLLVLCIFMVLLSSCAITRAPSLNLLEKRSDFNGIHEIEKSLSSIDNPLLVPVRTKPVIADIWVHPHELANGDYFRGAWIRTVVSRSSWMMDEKKEALLVVDKEVQENSTQTQGKQDGR